MARFLTRRLLIIPVALIAVLLLAYGYAHLVQWDYARHYPQLYYRLRVIQQRPESLIEAYQAYLPALLRLDFGTLRNGESIAVVLWKALQASLGLLVIALTASVPLGLFLGISASRWTRLRPARWLTLLSTTGLAMPSFYVGSLLILFSVAYALLRGGGGAPFPMAGFGWDKHLVLPALALMLRPTVQIAQVTGSLLTGELQKQYVVAARSLGHKWGTVKRRLAFRNVLAPVALTIAGSLRTLVTDLILVEWLFFWPGIGRFMAYSLIPANRTDMANSPYLLAPPFVAAILTLVAALFLLADFVASVLVRVFDPRLRVPTREEVADV
ncbi:MAG TPA: ABC transporter permease [Anaerolineae bacterium]|nr:ABC transporter permease [Anaerolineae bacterium]HQI83566.1 ABC transporter permease [Anaerolineae bacterium]